MVWLSDNDKFGAYSNEWLVQLKHLTQSAFPLVQLFQRNVKEEEEESKDD